jgi:hypothetical protein
LNSRSILKRVYGIAAYYVLLVQAFASIHAAEIPNSVAGGILDLGQFSYKSHGVSIQVLSGARNDLYKPRLQWGLRDYYFLPPFVIRKNVDGKRVGVTKIGDKAIITFTLRMAEVDVIELLEAIKKADHNPDASPQHVSPIRPFRLVVSLRSFPTSYVLETGTLRSLQDDIPVELEVPASYAGDLQNALENGAIKPRVTAQINFKGSTICTTNVSWSTVQSTSALKNLDSPAGPAYITAIQSIEMASKALSETKVDDYCERVSNNREKVEWLAAHLRSLQPTSVDLAAWLTSQGVNSQDLRQYTDVVKRIANAAKNSTDQEWCQKYSTGDKYVDSGKTGGSLGIDSSSITKAAKNIFGLKAEGSESQSTAEDHSMNQEDCGRNALAAQFDYDQEGTLYNVRSLRVYENLRGRVDKASESAWNTEEIAQWLQLVDMPVILE